MNTICNSKRTSHLNQLEDVLGHILNQVSASSLEVELGETCTDSFSAVSQKIVSICDDLQLPLDFIEHTFKDNFKKACLRFDTDRTTSGYKLNPLDRFLSNNIDRVRQLYIGVLDSVYCLHGRCPSQRAMKNFVIRYFIYSLIDKLEDAFKFHTAYLVCLLSPPSDLPVRPDFIPENFQSDMVIGGWIRRYFKSEKISLKDKIQLAMSLQNSKRAAKAISLDKQEKAVIDHQKNMMGKGYNPDPNTEWMLSKTKEKVASLTKIYYPPHLEKDIPVWRAPSYGACFEDLASSGGSSNYFSRFTKKDEEDYWKHYGMSPPEHIFSYKSEWTRQTLDDYLSLSMTAHHYGDIHYKESIPIFSFGFSIEDIREELNKNIKDRIENHIRTSCRYSMVLEPFKVRGVTMGEGDVYQMGRLIQPVLHGQLRNEKGPFRFIGKRHNDADINDVYSGSVLTTDNHFWNLCLNRGILGTRHIRTFLVAGDYKNATDNMHPDLPYTFVQTLKEQKSFTELWIKVLELTLSGHIIDYSQISSGKTGLDFTFNPEYQERIIQEWGQLMGSPTSFPVLNIVNAAMFWAACEIYENRSRTWKQILRDYRPLFNGDDISFLSNPLHYKTWEVLCASCGLSLSAGKNYCSSEFVNINSTNYFGEKTQISEHFFILKNFKELFVVNPGLIKGQSKVLGGSGEQLESLGSTCDQLEECVRVANDEQKTRCYEVFMHHMRDKLKQSKRPWTLPRMFGGLGLPFGNKPTLPQYMLAMSQFEKYRDLTDDSLKKENDRLAEEYLAQVLEQLNIEAVKGTIVRNDDKTNCQSDVETNYQSPSLSTSFLCSYSREQTTKAAKSILYPETKREEYFAQLYRKLWRTKDKKKQYIIKRKLKSMFKESQKRYSEIEKKRIGNSVQAERTYCILLKEMEKRCKELHDRYDDNMVPDDYQEIFKGYILKKGGLPSDISIDVSYTLSSLNFQIEVEELN